MLLARMEDLAQAALRRGCAASRFLTPAETEKVKSAFAARTQAVRVVEEGGFPDAERVRLVFLQPEWGRYERSDVLAALRISFRAEDALTHRDLLGALLALGMGRDSLGDIVVETDCATLVCEPEMAGYIRQNLTRAGRAGVAAADVALDTLTQRTQALRVKTASVSSLRLDALISAAFHVSRGEAARLIAEGRVNLQHSVCEEAKRSVAAGTVFSVRGLGRAKLLQTGGLSRKGRLFVEIGRYE